MKAKNRKKNLIARQKAFDEMGVNKAPHGFLYHRPGSNKR